MSIMTRTRKKGKRYTVRIDRIDPHTGARQKVTIGTYGTRREAERAEREAMSQRDHGTLLTRDGTTVNDLLDAYLKEAPHQVRSEQLNSYVSTIDRHLRPAFGLKLARDLTVHDVDALFVRMRADGLSSSSCAKAKQRLAQALDIGERWDIVSRNVARIAKAPRIEYQEPRIWSPEDVTAFLAVARDDPFWPLWPVLIDSAARRSEVLGLSWANIDLEQGMLALGRRVLVQERGRPVLKSGGKTKTALRTVSLAPPTIAALHEGKRRHNVARLANGPDWNPDDLVFINSAGHPVDPGKVGKRFKQLVEQAGVPPIKLHGLRHTSISLLLAAGGTVKAVQSRAGHARPETTLRVYTSLTDEQERTLASLMGAIMEQGAQVEGTS